MIFQILPLAANLMDAHNRDDGAAYFPALMDLWDFFGADYPSSYEMCNI
jgi:hypothetical protein